MKKFVSTTFIVAGLMLAATAANAAEICKPPAGGAAWLTREDATKKIMDLGYEVKTIVQEDGCWKITGAFTGKEVVGYFEPATANPVKVDPLPAK